MKDLGEACNVLGLEIEYDRNSKLMKLSHSKAITGILARFRMQECKRSCNSNGEEDSIFSLTEAV